MKNSLVAVAGRTLTAALLILVVSHLRAQPEVPKPVQPDALPGLRKLTDTPLRDTSICRGPDGTWYMTGTVEPFWGYNEGIKLWKSKDLVSWEPMGFVWKYGDSPWHANFLKAKKPLWAPEVHYLKGTFWLTYSMPGWDGTAKTSGSGLLKSTSGKPEGPYQDVQPGARLGDEIDASLFEDGDGTVYFLWHSGKIARMKPDMSGLAEPCHWLRTTGADPDPKHHSGLCAGIFGTNSFDHVGYEGMFLFKRDGRYYLSCAEEFNGRYSCAISTSTHLYGPYGARYEAIPHGGHNMFVRDGQGQWWSTYFGSDRTAPWQERPGLLTVSFDAQGRVHPGPAPGAASWQVGTPIVTYWAGPPMTDAVATQMAEGGWNLVWCAEKDLDLVGRHGLRAQLQDPLLVPASLDDPARLEKLDALIGRVRHHPALYAYFITDEPSAADFLALGRLVAHLRERDPMHLAYINLFPTYANNQQLGTKGDTVTAYQEHLRRYVDTVKPDLISYDHYQFTTRGDSDQYFLNLGMIRRAAEAAGVPFLNIVQACTWTPSMRVPQGDEMRYLVYTTLAHGAQGISYYVYSCAGHTGGIALADGSPTPLYGALKSLNREFVAVARELQPLRVLGVYHAGHHPRGTEPVPADSAFALDPPVADLEYRPPEPVRGVMLSCFAPAGQGAPTHALVVNLDYKSERVVGVRGPGPLSRFDATNGQWSAAEGPRINLSLPPGGGSLIRVR